MQAERWKQIEDLYQAAMAEPPEKRAQFVERACPGDPQLQAEVETLLKRAGERTSFFEGFLPFGPSEATPDAVIGAYHLLEPIGHGGMGEVWLAEQKEPVHRRVAIKLIKAGMDTREVVARFESERQALALMDHPAIAKVFEAGSTPLGRPYFAMEYVAGAPITDYCDRHKLTLRQRLELFVAVCDGVQHAHEKAILHRDLKPSNILVSEVDGKPAPRIIDFGVAKATAPGLAADTTLTRAGAIIGTPGYMSPEQADSAGVNVDTRTDVYSLGVVLYELLVGALPLDLSKTPLDQALRRLREEDVPRPSARLRTLDKQSGTAAQNRGSDPPTLARQLRGDLDAIVLKALEKDRARRYATPSELAADIGRYLRNELVTAHPASAVYRTRKYVRRHRVGVAVAAIIAVLLISAAVAQALAFRRVTRERDRADRIAAFMKGMFNVSPSAPGGKSVTALEILDKASKEIDTGLSKDPEMQAQLMQTMGEAYDSLGVYSQAQSLFTRAMGIQRRVLGPENPGTLTSMNSLGATLMRQGRYAEAEKLDRETLGARRRVLGQEHPETLVSMNNLGAVLYYEGRYAEAEKLERETLAIRRRVLGPAHPSTLLTMSNLAGTLAALGPEGYAEAEKLHREALDTSRRVLGPDHPITLGFIANLGTILNDEHRYAEAAEFERQTVDISRRVRGPEHPQTLISMGDLASDLDGEGHYAEAEKLCRETLDIQRRTQGPEHPGTLTSMNTLVTVLTHEGRYAEAEKLAREGMNIRRRVLGPEHPNTAASTYNVACVLAHKGNRDGALSLLQEAVDHGLSRGDDLGIEKDPDLKSLHGDPRFDALVAHAKKRAAAASKPK